MKTLTAAALAEIAKRLGTEPLFIIGIDWYETGSYFLYADKKVDGITDEANILNVSPVATTTSNTVGVATDLSVTLNDTDGHIKTILNTQNTYQKPCIVYQFFDGLSSSDKFVVFKGVLDNPIQWLEQDRSINIQVLSEIEDQEIGVSLEETDIVDYDLNVTTHPWPLAFGNVVHVPATKVVQYPIAILSEPFCNVDQMLFAQLEALNRAWFEQQWVLIFWQLVSQGAVQYQGIPSVLLAQYIYWIKLEAYYTGAIKTIRLDLAGGRKHRHRRRNKTTAEKNLVNRKDDLRDDLDALRPELKAIKVQKDLIERQIDLAQFFIDLNRAATVNMANAVNGMLQIYQNYINVMNEICEQFKCVKTEVKVEDSENFPQGETLNLIINNLKWVGQFNNNILTMSPVPLPRYTDIPLASRQSALDECGNIEEMKGMDLFWISDASYNLVNMYLLVKNIDRNWRHIIKVIEQEGTKCRFELVAFGDFNLGGEYSNQVVQSSSSIPTLNTSGWGDLPSGQNPVPDYNPILELTAQTLMLLNPVLPNDDETKKLKQLEKLTRFESYEPSAVSLPDPRTTYTIVGPNIVAIHEAAPVPLPSWFNWPIYLEEYPSEIRWIANAGTEIRESGKEHDIFVANILPSTVKAIHAYRTVDNEKVLTPVPTAYYSKNESEQLKDAEGNTKLTITSIRVKVPLSHIQGEQWEDQIYVTMDSSVGPNTVDILEYFINTYTDKSINSTTFDAVKIRIDNYPSSFALFDRPNVYEIITQIASQARCAAYMLNDIFYIKYLAEEPTTDRIITEVDVDVENSFDIAYGNADNLVTRLFAKWRPNYLPDKERFLTLRHNINIYGLHEREEDFFIYNIEELVLKSATFWMIRWSNLWKQVDFSTFLPNLDLDLYDTVLFDFDRNYLATGDIKSVIEGVNYDSNQNQIMLSCWTPVRVGEMTVYPFAWPADLPADEDYPTELEILQGRAGGSGIGRGIVTEIQGQ